MAKYDWEFIKPLDQSATIANMAYGNKQITEGLQGMVGAVTGLADTYKQRNTDEILNALYGAQTSADLPTAMSAVQALQAQYGRGYDQAKVREAIDSRGSTLGQRDLQAINLQQAQAAQAAIPTLNQAAMLEAVRQGANPEQLSAMAALGIDATGQISRMGSNAQSDARYAAETAERKANRAEDVAWRKSQANQAQQNWQADFDYRQDQSNWNRAGDLAKENPASFGYGTDGNGNPVTISNPGINRMDAYGALSGVRGIRNNNPGNIEFFNQPGASLESKGGRFARFSTPEQGINAMSKQLDLYFTGKSQNVTKPINTIQDIITTWAPPKNKKGQVENNTAAYIASVAKAMGVSPTAKLNLHDPNTKAALMSAMITHENGGNPYTREQYIAGITGRIGSASQAMTNVGGGSVSQQAMSKVTSSYQDNIAKLTADFNINEAKANTKGSLASTGKNVDTWLADKKEFSLTGGGTNPIYTRSADIAKMAKAEPLFNNLPADAQLKILDGAYGFVNSTGLFEYVPNKELKKFIKNESSRIKTDSKAQLNTAKSAAFEQAYQDMVQAYQAAGVKPPTRDGARKILDPQAPASAPAPKVQVIADKKPEAKAAVAAVKPATPAKSNIVKADTSKMDKVLADRAKRKKAEADAINARAKAEKSKEKAKGFIPTKPLLTQTTTMTPKQINDLMEKYKVR